MEKSLLAAKFRWSQFTESSAICRRSAFAEEEELEAL